MIPAKRLQDSHLLDFNAWYAPWWENEVYPLFRESVKLWFFTNTSNRSLNDEWARGSPLFRGIFTYLLGYFLWLHFMVNDRGYFPMLLYHKRLFSSYTHDNIVFFRDTWNRFPPCVQESHDLHCLCQSKSNTQDLLSPPIKPLLIAANNSRQSQCRDSTYQS